MGNGGARPPLVEVLDQLQHVVAPEVEHLDLVGQHLGVDDRDVLVEVAGHERNALGVDQLRVVVEQQVRPCIILVHLVPLGAGDGWRKQGGGAHSRLESNQPARNDEARR